MSCNLKHGTSSTTLSGSDKKEKHETPLISVTPPKRRFMVEPLIFCHILSAVPLDIVNQFFLYGKMEELVAKTFEQDRMMIILGQQRNNTKTKPCGQEANLSSYQHDFINQVQAETAHFNMVSFAVMTLPTIVSTILLSAYSDKCGRKIAILPPLLASAIYAIIYLHVVLLDLSPWVLMVGYFLNGISGNAHLMMAGCYAYISDTTTKEQRQIQMTILTLARIIPQSVASIVAGRWVQHRGYVWPTAFSVMGSVLCVLYATLLLPETIKKGKGVTFFTLQHFRQGIKVFLPNGENSTAPHKLYTLVLIITLYYLGTGSWAASSLYQLNAPLCWDAVTVSYYHTVNTAVAAVGGLCSAFVLKRLATDEQTAIIAGTTYTVAYLYLAQCKNTPMMFLRPTFNIFAVLLLPTTRTLLSKQVSNDQQGSMCGVISVLEALAGFAGNEFFVYVYAQTLHVSPTFVFYIAAALYMVVTLIYIFYNQHLTTDQDRTDGKGK